MADIVFNGAREYIGDGTIDLDDDDIRCMLLANTYTPDITDDVKADLVAHELASASGYTAGGYLLQGVTWVRAGAIVTLDATDPVWTTASFTCRYAVIYDDTPAVSPIDPLICMLDLSADRTGLGGNFYINFNASGICQIT